MIVTKKALTLLTLTLAAAGAYATDYYVAMTGNDGNDGSSEAPFATIDKAVKQAVANDNIYVAPGEYETNTANGPDLKANLIGTGATRNETVIMAGNLTTANYRTLKMEAGSLATNLTFVGNTAYQVAMGGTIYMAGGTLADCVIKDGTCKSGGSNNNAGGNIYTAAADCLVENCEISGGSARNRGGNVCLDRGTLRGCTISNGVAADGSDNIGGNVWTYQGHIEKCTLTDGRAVNGGNLYMQNASSSVSDSTISGGVATGTGWDQGGGNVFANPGRLTRCVITGGSMTDKNQGGGIRSRNASTVIEDCLVYGNANGGICLEGKGIHFNNTVVSNEAYGIWGYGSNPGTFRNCIVFGNHNNGNINEWSGNRPAVEDMSNCAFGTDYIVNSGVPITNWENCLQITEADFVGAAGGNWRINRASALVDAGIADARDDASTTDLDGNPRLSGPVDIGCYEYQKQDLIVHIDSRDYSPAYAPSTVTFVHASENSASPENVVFTYDFGDGSATEETTALSISHVYAAPGVYTVKISATNECEEESAEMTYPDFVRVASSTVYVTPGNGAGTFPYDTPEKGYGNLKTAVQAALDGYTLLLAPGVHETVDQVSFNKALTLRGIGATPESVIVRNITATPDTYYHRTLEMNNAAGRIENITIENGCVKNTYGGNLRLVTGVVSNCIIRGGLAVADGGNAAGAAVELVGAGVITHCVISNNVVQGTSSDGNFAGGAIFLPYNSKNGRISNCLIAHNRYITSGETIKTGAAAVRFYGTNDGTAIENCTIGANVVEGSLSDDSAGIYCTSWSVRFRNNLIVGNSETGKESYSTAKIDSHCAFDHNLTDDAASPAEVFADFANGDFSLTPTSRARNKGTSSGLALLPAVDLAGNPRVFGKAIDIGCFEAQKTPGFSVFIR
ncbi:MAG: right-handed parallel beta-helix repeat-containing protein [Kiritimatiellae bacterium]|nr:right-handed parallel beta-helix repeat-containing protein [Kiritimatiellia bacterium]